MERTTEQAIATLLREAEHAHGIYEQMALAGGRDEAWPEWYANYLLDHGLARWLPAAATAGPRRLADLLQSFAAAYDQEPQDVPWPELYAARLVATLATAP